MAKALRESIRMKPLYCTKGHENLNGNRFCSQCGEKLPDATVEGAPAGTILAERYRLVRELGYGGFGRTYLAADTNRFNEPCVLKEFAPQVQVPKAVLKARELFEREAGVLYKLQHSQIPKFRELCQGSIAGSDCLFLVQDYVEGETYRAVLNARKANGDRFTEAEVTQMLRDILPVLHYIHSQGSIHRDISPENLILRSSDNLPVLIDFGGVKQVAASAISKFSQMAALPTYIGKPGYAPEEQLRLGKAYPSSDLYSLAVTALVLLTGKEPKDLQDSYKGVWLWRREVTLSPNLEAVLDRMLAFNPGDRFQSAEEVLLALQGAIALPQMGNVSEIKTAALPPQPAAIRLKAIASLPAIRNPIRLPRLPLQKQAIAAAGIIVLIAFATSSVPALISQISPLPGIGSVAEESRRQTIAQRRENLQISEEFFNRLVNELFHSQHPDIQQQILTDAPEDAKLRQQWYKLADEWLGKLEKANLSEEVRRQLGNYGQKDYKKWQRQVNIAALTRLADARFYELFPELQGVALNPETLGQIWYAIAADRLNGTVPHLVNAIY